MYVGACFKEIGLLTSSILLITPHLIVHTIERTYIYSIEESTKHALPITITRSGSDFVFDFGSCFIMYLLIRHKFYCVYLIGSSWRT